MLLGFLERPSLRSARRSKRSARKLAIDDSCKAAEDGTVVMATDLQASVTELYDAPANTSDAEEIRDHQSELADIQIPNRLFCAEKQNSVKPRDATGGKEEEPALIVVSRRNQSSRKIRDVFFI